MKYKEFRQNLSKYAKVRMDAVREEHDDHNILPVPKIEVFNVKPDHKENPDEEWQDNLAIVIGKSEQTGLFLCFFTQGVTYWAKAYQLEKINEKTFDNYLQPNFTGTEWMHVMDILMKKYNFRINNEDDVRMPSQYVLISPDNQVVVAWNMREAEGGVWKDFITVHYPNGKIFPGTPIFSKKDISEIMIADLGQFAKFLKEVFETPWVTDVPTQEAQEFLMQITEAGFKGSRQNEVSMVTVNDNLAYYYAYSMAKRTEELTGDSGAAVDWLKWSRASTGSNQGNTPALRIDFETNARGAVNIIFNHGHSKSFALPAKLIKTARALLQGYQFKSNSDSNKISALMLNDLINKK